MPSGGLSINVSLVPNGPKFRQRCASGKNVAKVNARKPENTVLLILAARANQQHTENSTGKINPVIAAIHREYKQTWKTLDHELAYGRCFADRPNLMVCLRSMPNVFTGSWQNALLLERSPAVPPSKRAHTGKVAVKESNQRWCSDGFEFRCDNGEKLRVTFALDCCDREALHWAVTTGGFDSETVQDVMLGAVERRFGNELPASPVEWLTDNGSCYRANETRQFARMLGLEPKNTAVRSPESNGIAESFVKTIKRTTSVSCLNQTG